jgi:UDP-N-acetyl-2-amino-2-deoxyglucuronate dehydrogenase
MTHHIGLIGGGNITETHARAARAIPGVEISAIHGTNAEKIARLCREHGGTPYQDFDAFLDHRPMDLVIIGSPSGLHAAQGVAAARHGLHVLTEKPIEISTARADILIDGAKNSNVQLGVIFQDRMKPHIRQLKSWLDQGLLGKVSHSECPREVVSPAGVLFQFALARHSRSRRRRRLNQSRYPHR